LDETACEYGPCCALGAAWLAGTLEDAFDESAGEEALG